MRRFLFIIAFSFVLCGSGIAFDATSFQGEEYNVYETVDGNFASVENLLAVQDDEEDEIFEIMLRAMPEKPGDPPGVPVDDAYGFLLAAMLLYGLKRMYKRKTAKVLSDNFPATET